MLYFETFYACAEECLTTQEALRTYTIWAARHIFMEDKIGSLEAGKYSDMVVWDRDLYTAPTRELREIKALQTLVNGKIVYEA